MKRDSEVTNEKEVWERGGKEMTVEEEKWRRSKGRRKEGKVKKKKTLQFPSLSVCEEPEIESEAV